MTMTTRPKGTPKTGGRILGTANKVSNKTVKENIIAVFNRLDGTAGMAKWAQQNPNNFYAIYSKLIPAEVETTLTHDGKVELNVNFR